MSSSKKILIIVSGQVNNVALADRVSKIASEQNFEVEVLNLLKLNWPLFPCLKEQCPEDIQKIYEKIKSVSKLVFAVPEYNGGLPPVLTNFIAWMSSCKENWREAFEGKRALLVTHSGGKGERLFKALRTQFDYIGIEVIDRDFSMFGRQNDDEINQILCQAVKDL